MAVQFHMLASGSSGNAGVLDVGGFGVLIDFGLSGAGRRLAERMQPQPFRGTRSTPSF